MNIFLGVALGAAAVYVTVSILIIRELDKRGHKVNPMLLRLFLTRHVNHYREIMIEETGSPGKLFYLWIISINLTLVLVILSILLG